MPSFALRNINAACGVMHRYIDAEGAPSREKKHHDLSRDTKRLVTALAAKGKLAGLARDLDASCTSFAPELETCPADAANVDPGSTECCLASAFWCSVNGRCLRPGTAMSGGVCGAGGTWLPR